VTRTYTASLGGGAKLNGSRSIRTSDVTEIEKSLLVTGFGYDHGPAWAMNMEFFKHFTDKARGVRRLGAASVDLCHVACGMVESYWEYLLKPWDTCAGVIILTEAGGKVTTLDGQAYSPFHRSLLASNGRIHSRMLEVTTGPTKNLTAGNNIDLSTWMIPPGYDVQ
jgi:myo-inositol-1(or 4)-monophosphatase